MPFYYTYAYIRQYAGRGDVGHKRKKWLSIYADRGMGRGGSGGWVAAALHEGLVSEGDILDAWHTGGDVYERFIDDCEEQIESGGKLPSAKRLPNSIVPSGKAEE